MRPLHLTPRLAWRLACTLALALGGMAEGAEVTCEPAASPHPPFYAYDVHPKGGAVTVFRVETEDLNEQDGSYADWIQPAGWSHTIDAAGWIVWSCEPGGTGCPLSQATHRFGFTNFHPSRWGLWETESPADDSFASSHISQPDGEGRLVHVPTKFFGGDVAPTPPDPQDLYCYDVTFHVENPDGMDLADFHFTQDCKTLPIRIDGSYPQGHIPGLQPVTYCICLDKEPDGAYLEYRWTGPPPVAAPTRHEICPLKTGCSPHELPCADPLTPLWVERSACDQPAVCAQQQGCQPPGISASVEGLLWIDEAEDQDKDGVADCIDNCIGFQFSAVQLDSDGDGVGDQCDANPFDNIEGLCPCDGPGPSASAPARPWDCAINEYKQCVVSELDRLLANGLIDDATRATLETQALGGTCGVQPSPQDSDCDGVPDTQDNCPFLATGGGAGQRDDDQDGVGEWCDNCPHGVANVTYNPNQLDSDGDQIGDVCDPTP
ncbi:MAG: thrombospondin type 3 repeat-containing protein [Acidobacteriota bacterium]